MSSVAAGQVELLFLGTGTSAGVPMIGCHCAVCDSADSRDKRMRPSVVISYGETRVLVDTTVANTGGLGTFFALPGARSSSLFASISVAIG